MVFHWCFNGVSLVSQMEKWLSEAGCQLEFGGFIVSHVLQQSCLVEIFDDMVRGEVFLPRLQVFSLPKYFLVFSFGLHAFNFFPYCFIYFMLSVAQFLVYGNWLITYTLTNLLVQLKRELAVKIMVWGSKVLLGLLLHLSILILS